MIGFRLLSFPLRFYWSFSNSEKGIYQVYMDLLFSTFVEALNRIHKETLPHRAANRDILSLISITNFHLSLRTKTLININVKKM